MGRFTAFDDEVEPAPTPWGVSRLGFLLATISFAVVWAAPLPVLWPLAWLAVLAPVALILATLGLFTRHRYHNRWSITLALLALVVALDLLVPVLRPA